MQRPLQCTTTYYCIHKLVALSGIRFELMPHNDNYLRNILRQWLRYYRPVIFTSRKETGLPVNSSQGHLVTRSTRRRSTRHTHVSSHSQLITSEHITKPPVPVVIISARRQETSRNSVQHGGRNYRYLCYFNVYCRIQITATDYTSTKSTVNSSQRRETRRSTRHMILLCDELTV